MIVLDANILIRAVLGRRVRQLIETYAAQGFRFVAPQEFWTVDVRTDAAFWAGKPRLIVQFNYLPAVRAKVALDRANPGEALEILRAAEPYELGLPSRSFYNWPNLYPVYVRGEAYLAAHQGQKAAAEFQKILNHPGIVLNEPIGALAHLQLGRAYVMQGQTAEARAAYQNFLTFWKDADLDSPILNQAKAEYAKLQ